jgi:ParB family chromosome partitioning protein
MAKLQLEDYLPTLEETSAAADGQPLRLPLDQIDEDPSQPRHEFDVDALNELAVSIGSRGVLQPVSVRPHPQRAGRYLLNFGARRLRASRLAGKTEIPAFVDVLATSYDQVIENEHREALRPMELALFIKRELDAGQSQADVASRLGKSRAYICYVSALIDPPDWLMEIYREGRCRGVKELYDLRRLHEEHPDAVGNYVAERGSVARADVDALREQIGAGAARAVRSGSAPREAKTVASRSGVASVHQSNAKAEPGAHRPARCMLLADAGTLTVEVILVELPPAIDEVYVVENGNADLREAVKIAALQRLRLRREE